MNNVPGDIHLSVILPVCHSGRFLRKALHSLKSLTFQADKFEVLVAGRMDDEASLAIIKEEAEGAAIDIRYIPCSSDRKAGFLTAACLSARGKYWIFTDDDCYFPPDWLERYAEVFAQDPRLGMIGGPDVLQPGASGFDRALDYVLKSPLVKGKFLRGFSQWSLVHYYPKLFNMGVSRDVAYEVARADEDGSLQVFDESLSVHEDVDLAKRIEAAGHSLVFKKKVRVSHFRDTNWRSFLARNFNLGKTCRKLKVHHLPQTLLALLVLGMGVSLLAGLLLGTLGGAVFLLPGAYALVLILSAMHGSLSTRSIGALFRIPGLMAGLHFSRGLGYLLPIRSK
jgi:glycosyltransferase involved in cell wall biosynthesis